MMPAVDLSRPPSQELAPARPFYGVFQDGYRTVPAGTVADSGKRANP